MTHRGRDVGEKAMDAAAAGVLAAAVGVGGTLGSAWLTGRRGDAARRHEWERLERTRLADLTAQRVQEALAARREAYTAFNAAARHYLACLSDHAHALRLDAAADPAETLDAVESARVEYRQRYAEAQMIVPDAVLAEVRLANNSVGAVYGILARLTRGGADEGDEVEVARRRIKEGWRVLARMRATMRADLRVTAPSHE
ncbi:hypothetical protein ABZZ36_39755 [Actinacidiphila glaucinigra]|uniref:hypothetical protein n=1 Tax=Actinacidiphila glaucinigra TaxID=235986 RepID=UPI0033B37BC1